MNPRLLYRGLAPSVINMGVLTGVQFPMTGAIQGMFTGGAMRELSAAEAIGSGFLGGAASGLICAPMELIMIQQQRFGGSLASVPSKVVSQLGPQGLFRGLLCSSGREALYTAGYLGIGPSIKGALQERGYDDKTALAGGAIIGGVIAATLSHPLDTIKTCMQGDLKGEKYGSLSSTARTIFQEGGHKQFFRGFGWRTTRMILSIAIIGEIKDRVAPSLFPKSFNADQQQ